MQYCIENNLTFKIYGIIFYYINHEYTIYAYPSILDAK